jgi:hypothetical protein
MEIRSSRLKIARCLLIGGIKLSKLSDPLSGLMEILEKGSAKLTVKSIREAVPTLQEMELIQLKQELKNADFFSIIYDGTTEVCEMFALIVRWFDKSKMKIEQRLVSCSMLQKSMTGVEICRQIIDMLTKYHLAIGQILSNSRDGASNNTVAVTNLKNINPNIIDVICTSHSGHLCGDQFDCPLLKSFISSWSSMMSQSNIAKQKFKNLVGRKAKRKSAVRWGAEFQVIDQVLTHYSTVVDLINDADEFSTSHRAALSAILKGPVPHVNMPHLTNEVLLKLEMAVTVDCGKCIYDFIYQWEGDGLVTPYIYSAMKHVTHL